MRIEEAIRKYKVICIIRNAMTTKLVEAVDVMAQAGIRLFEVTLNQKDGESIKESVQQIDLLNKTFGNNIFLGAGTVMKPEQVDMVHEVGARYIISPDTSEKVIKQTLKRNLVSIPGAFTPTEIAFAYQCGAHMVKLFPAGVLGLKYIKDLKGPLGHIPLLAVGGVDSGNIKAFLDAGVLGVGIGSSLANPIVINNGQWDVLKANAKIYADVARLAD
ncbi:MAG TPA: 2-dehydro-3-deoxyphosphogluconate aldolase [Clostridiales bacterium]|mgnify:CR=1 FL=1|nr:2-dehydro-3-deoxyphosphogluconate aldolase [Clostridiales bacterium]